MNPTTERLIALAEARPADAALVAPGCAPMSFAGLWQQTQQVGAELRRRSIGEHDRVAIVLPNGPVMASAFVAVSSYATAAPLNPAFTVDEFCFYLEDLKAAALVVPSSGQEPARAAAARCGVPLIELNSGHHAGAFEVAGAASAQVPEAPAEGSSVALLLHTSGTTSKPKLVPLTHTNLAASASNVARSLALTEHDVCLNVMPLFHIHGLVAALLATLHSGGCLACAPGLDARAFLVEWLPELRPTWYTAVPTMHQSILEAAVGELPQHTLRLVRSSSASLAPVVKDALEARFGVPVIEAYGMTEAAHQMAANPLPPSARKSGSVGVAAGPEVAIMAEDSPALLEPSALGEVVIRGPNVTAGYLNRPEANEDAFVDGWFRTGDQGYFDGDGYLFLTGRLKEIINRGGEKVSPREVDEAALTLPGVTQAVTFAVTHRALGEDVAMAVVAGPGVTESELRKHLFQQLAAFKVPSQIVLVDKIPKGPTGKLQRIGLADQLADELRAEHVPPRDGFEELVAGIFAAELGAESVGALDNFFAAGGDSLKGVRMMNTLADRFEVALAGADLFRAPTVEQLCGLLTERLVLADAENRALVDTLRSMSLSELEALEAAE